MSYHKVNKYARTARGRPRLATPTMLLANPDSGVPLASNAKYLHNFFCKDSVQGVNFVDQARGGVIIDTTELGRDLVGDEARRFNTNPDGSFTITGGIAPGVFLDSMLAGTWPQINTADDFMFVSCLIAGEDTAEGSSIWRIGSTPSYIRRHSQPNDGVSTSVSGSVNDEDGDQASELGAVAADRAPIGATLCVVTVLDRTANLLRSRTYDIDTNIEYFDPSASTVNIDDVFPSNKPDLTAPVGKSVPHSFFGRYFGTGHFLFPNAGLPDDYFEVAIQIAKAWRDGNYTFWAPWGIE